jgi:dTDP-4-dehydrorhamnose reductase
MKQILILGANGMLGTAMVNEFSSFVGKVSATTRNRTSQDQSSSGLQIQFDAAKDSIEQTFQELPPFDFVINCIGVIKPHIVDSDPIKRANAVVINTVFPQKLEAWSSTRGTRVIQIATDCVFSGNRGEYLESDPHDAWDVYGKTKSLGEVPSSAMMHLRASIIGPEVGRSTSLVEWVRGQPRQAVIQGYTDHLWNGITTVDFARITRGIIESDNFSSGTQHLVPEDDVSKFSLVTAIAKHYGRDDLTISPSLSGKSINRTLRTGFPERNESLWLSAGYRRPPSVSQMVNQLPN